MPIAKTLLICFIALLFSTAPITQTFAETKAVSVVYVPEGKTLVLRAKASSRAKAVAQLPAGTVLTIVGGKNKSGFAQVKLEDGTTGFVQLRQTSKTPPANSEAPIDAAVNPAPEKDVLVPTTPLEKSLTLDRNKLSLELGEIKRAASNVIQLKNERDELQERIVNAERKLEQLERENAALKNTSSQDWFLYGGFVSIISTVLGFVLPKLNLRSKGRWDSY